MFVYQRVYLLHIDGKSRWVCFPFHADPFVSISSLESEDVWVDWVDIQVFAGFIAVDTSCLLRGGKVLFFFLTSASLGRAHTVCAALGP